MKNKKGDISVTILIIGVFCVCVFAMFSFLSSGLSLSDSFIGVSYLEKTNAVIEDASFNKTTLGEFYLEKNETYLSLEFGLDWLKERTIFSVKYEKP